MPAGKPRGLARRAVLVLLLVSTPTWSQQASAPGPQLWATWELDLQGQAPPSHFVLTVEETGGATVPPPMQIPWAPCPTIPQAQHCAPVGCPPLGTYRFWVQAQYAAGLSGPSNTITCQRVAQTCTCGAPAGVVPSIPLAQGTPPRPLAPQASVPPGLVLSQASPPLVALTAADLGLKPVGTIPGTSTIPPIPSTGGV